MHLIKNKQASAYSSSKTLNSKINGEQSIQKNHLTTSNFIMKSQANNTATNSKNQQTYGLITRAFSNTKSIIQKMMNSSKQNEINNEAEIIGNKYIYKKTDMIGKGYSSQVYKGSYINNSENKNLAIKILDLSKIKGFLYQLLKKQISIHQSLDHENIVKCFDVIQTKTHIYLIQQYCSGGDLSAFINQRKSKIPEGQALKIMSQIVEGYKYLVKQNILHRDLKPCNIFKCGKNKKWKIGDFGFACKTYQELDDVNVGTPIYMPPQSLQKSLYSHKSDFFSLGVIMHEIIYGKVPWFSKSQSLLVKKMKEIKIDFQKQKPLIVNPKIRKFIQNCCQIDKQKRIQQEQFLKIQLFPRQTLKLQIENRKLKKSNSKIKDEDSKISSKIQSAIQRQRSKQKQKFNNSSKSKFKSGPKNLSITHQQKISSIANNSQIKNDNFSQGIGFKDQKISKLSQYSTQPQTRVIQVVSSIKQNTETKDTNDTKSIAVSSQQSYFAIDFKANSEVLYKQIQFCKHLYYMIKNVKHFSLSCQKKQHLTIIVYKHIIYLLKKLKNSKFNYFDLKKWENYRESKHYATIYKQICVDLELIQKQYLKYLKHKDIKLLRQVNSKFPELSHNADFNIKFYKKISQWLRHLIHQFSLNCQNDVKNQSVGTQRKKSSSSNKNELFNLSSNPKERSKSKLTSKDKFFVKSNKDNKINELIIINSIQQNRKPTINKGNTKIQSKELLKDESSKIKNNSKKDSNFIKKWNQEKQSSNDKDDGITTGQKIKAKVFRNTPKKPEQNSQHMPIKKFQGERQKLQSPRQIVQLKKGKSESINRVHNEFLDKIQESKDKSFKQHDPIPRTGIQQDQSQSLDIIDNNTKLLQSIEQSQLKIVISKQNERRVEQKQENKTLNKEQQMKSKVQQKQKQKQSAQYTLNVSERNVGLEDLNRQQNQVHQAELNEEAEMQILNLNKQAQSSEYLFYDKVPHATLQSLQSLFRYYLLMETKINSNTDIHTSFSVINLHHQSEDENILCLLRDYEKAKFKKEDIDKIKNLVRFL